MNKSQLAFALLFLTLISSGYFPSGVSALSPSKVTVSSSASGSTVTGLSHEPLPTRRSLLSTAAWSLMLGESVLAGNPSLANAAEQDSFEYTRTQTVMNKKELKYQISIPSTMNEGSKPVKTHLDEVNFVSESVKRYQYGITVDPVRISSLKEVSCVHTILDSVSSPTQFHLGFMKENAQWKLQCIFTDRLFGVYIRFCSPISLMFSSVLPKK